MLFAFYFHWKWTYYTFVIISERRVGTPLYILLFVIYMSRQVDWAQSTIKHKQQQSTSFTGQSLPSKGEELKYYITEKAIDVCAITKSWIQKDATDESLKVVTPEGYAITSKPHQDGHKGGGIALMYSKVSITLMEQSPLSSEKLSAHFSKSD